MEEKRRSAFPIGLAAFAVSGAAIQVVVLWFTNLPLGVSNEWVWPRFPYSAAMWWTLLPACLAGGILLVYVNVAGRLFFPMDSSSTTSNRPSPTQPRFRQYLALAGLCLIGTWWILSAVAAIPGAGGLSRSPFVLFYPRSSGYFTQARTQARDLKHFLTGYEESIRNSDDPVNYLHLGTHPPGLTMVLAGMLRACENSPGLREFALATQPASFRDGFEVLKSTEPGLRDADSAVFWLATLITAALAAGTCWPLCLIARRFASPQAAWWATAMWLLVPAVVVFLPKSDIAFPFLTMLMQWLWLVALDRRSFTVGALLGCVMLAALCLSLAFLPVGLILLAQVICTWSFRTAETSNAPIQKWTFNWRPVLGSAVSFALLLGIVWWGTGLNLPAVWQQNLKNHAAFYAHNTRSFWPWLLENPLELGFALGLPLGILAFIGLLLVQQVPIGRRLQLLIPIAVWMLLWVSGKNMGESARLWIFLMPYCLVLAAVTLERVARQSSLSSRWVNVLFCLQMAVCMATALRIDGFQFGSL